MATELTAIAAWARGVGISRQAGYQAIKRCAIPVVDGKVDAQVATMLYERETRARIRVSTRPRPAAIAPRPTAAIDELLMDDGRDSIEHVNRLVALAGLAYADGQPGLVEEEQLRLALRLVRPSLRDQVKIERTVWDSLTAAVARQLGLDAATPSDCPSMTPRVDDDETAWLARFWYSVAAGEVKASA